MPLHMKPIHPLDNECLDKLKNQTHCSVLSLQAWHFPFLQLEQPLSLRFPQNHQSIEGNSNTNSSQFMQMKWVIHGFMTKVTDLDLWTELFADLSVTWWKGSDVWSVYELVHVSDKLTIYCVEPTSCRGQTKAYCALVKQLKHTRWCIC